MFYRYTEDELRSYCRTSIEALEKWARLVVDLELTKKYGNNYFNQKMENGDPVIKKEINKKAEEMLAEEPGRFRSKIDTLFLDEIIYILCKVQLYKGVFKKVLDKIYPDGCAEARTYLERLIPIRNKLSHSQPISVREAEKAICYCNDFIDGIKEYFREIGEERMFNVPHAIRLNDSLGNEFVLKNEGCPEIIYIKDTDNEMHKFQVGDKYKLWVTMEPSFSREQYQIEWKIINRKVSTNEIVKLDISEEMVAKSRHVECRIIQNKAWHKYPNEDHRILIVMCVLPPNE